MRAHLIFVVTNLIMVMKLITDLCDPKFGLDDDPCALTLYYSLDIEKCILEVWAWCC